MKNYKKLSSILFVSVAVLLLKAGTSNAQNASEQLFEKALYSEEMKGDLAEAVKTYQQVLKENPDNRQVSARALLHIGMCYEKLGSEQARQAYQDVIIKYSEQVKEASLARERIIRLENYTAELNREAEKHMKNGNDLFKRWEYESAVREYENAIKLIPNTLLAQNAQYCIGQSWFRAGKYDSALATFTKLIEENPKSNIAPVTELMVVQVQNAMENSRSREKVDNTADENVIIDPKTGIKYSKIKSFVGKNDVITYTSAGLNLTPDGRFMVSDNKIIPVDGSEAFNLVDIEATRAVYAPDMKKASFYADSAIWIVPVSPITGHSNGSPVKLLEGKYRWQNNVSWSPDGGKLAFQRNDKNFSGDIWTISVSDGSLSAVTDKEAAYRGPAWSPDGKTIAYWKDKEVWLSPIEGGEPKRLIDFGGVPLWSPDGKWLYHSSWELRKLFCLSDNQNFDLIMPKEVGDFVAFSPDSKKVLFYRSSSDYKYGFKVVSFSGGPSFEPERDFDLYDAQWSLDSKKILVRAENEVGDFIYRIVPFGKDESYLLNINVNVNGKPFPFSISSDQNKLAFTIRLENGRKDLYVVPISVKDARTTGPADLVFEGWSMAAYNVDFSWSPDGSKIALTHENDIWVIPLTGGKPNRITNTPEKESWIRWSPDGKMISFYTHSKSVRTLNVVPESGGKSSTVVNDCRFTAWSPDSKGFVVYSGGIISILNLDGRQRKQIFNQNDLNLDNLSAPEWSPDGRYLAFVGYKSKENESRLFMIPSGGGKITELAPDDDSEKSTVYWSPDGKWIGFLTEGTVKVRPEGSLWEADFNEIVEKLVK